MSGDWLKMDLSTPEKPEVLAITARMGWDDPDMTVGKLFRVWRWFDQHTTDGNAARVTSALLDRITGVSGFAQAMQEEGWLIVSDAGLTLPNFEKHNGATAKTRAQTAKRVANHRASEESNDGCNGKNVTTPLAREEKRREEKKEETKSIARGSRLPDDFDPDFDFAVEQGIANTLEEASKFRDYWRAQPGQKGVKTDWPATWRNWCRNAKPSARASPLTFRERDAANAAARVHEMTGGLVSAKPAPITRRNDALQEVFDATPRITA